MRLSALYLDGCKALKQLNCQDNYLKELDVRDCTFLKELDCSANMLTELDVSGCTALTTLYCYDNSLTELNVSGCTALTTLYCYENSLTELNVSGCAGLELLRCRENQLEELDVSKCTALTELMCGNNLLSDLDVSHQPALKKLGCESNFLSNLDLSGNAKLTVLSCNDNFLSVLDLSRNPALTEAYCGDNLLYSLKLNTALIELSCSNNLLTALDLSRTSGLGRLYCGDNLLTSLDVHYCQGLRTLECQNNQLTSLNLINNPEIMFQNSENNVYPIYLTASRTYDLSKLPGSFEKSRASNWKGGSVSGKTLTADKYAEEVTYVYQCGNGKNERFTLLIADDTNIRDFVTRFYQVILGRDPEQKGLDDWTERLKNGTSTGATVGQGFIMSPEYQNKKKSDAEFLYDLYAAFFDRDPDEGGFGLWMKYLQNGVSREGVMYGFLASPEFAVLCQLYGIRQGSYEVQSITGRNPDVTSFCARMYTVCMERQYDEAGLEAWVGGLLRGEFTGEFVGNGFFMSQEYKDKHASDDQYVRTLYRTIFDREADEVGYAFWVEQLEKGMSRQDVYYGFSRSQEFQNLCARFGVRAY